MSWKLHPEDLAEAVGQSLPFIFPYPPWASILIAVLSIPSPVTVAMPFASCTVPSTKLLLYKGSWTWPESNSAKPLGGKA